MVVRPPWARFTQSLTNQNYSLWWWFPELGSSRHGSLGWGSCLSCFSLPAFNGVARPCGSLAFLREALPWKSSPSPFFLRKLFSRLAFSSVRSSVRKQNKGESCIKMGTKVHFQHLLQKHNSSSYRKGACGQGQTAQSIPEALATSNKALQKRSCGFCTPLPLLRYTVRATPTLSGLIYH